MTFSKVGLKVSVPMRCGAWQRPRASQISNEDEYDLNVQWAAKDGLVGEEHHPSGRDMPTFLSNGGGDPDISDFRLIINYDF